ncbi:hypothetical protein PAPHI01_2397 [Pancytospora philotis]|nr:hypothetical protein PAPHI01_2397 [Pancytospora philotis]
MVLVTLFALLVHSLPAKHDGAIDARLYRISEYGRFGATDAFDFSNLEERVLDPLYGYSVKHSSPETPQTIIDGQLLMIPAEDKARDLIFSVLSDGSTPSLLDRLLSEFGYGGHLLLKKVFYEPYVQYLRALSDAKPQAQTHDPSIDGSSEHRVFSRLVGKSSEKLDGISQAVSMRITTERIIELKEYAEHYEKVSNGIDYALLTLWRYYHGDKRLVPEYTDLLDFWFGDDDRFKRQINTISDYANILMRPGLVAQEKLTAFKKPLFERIFCRNLPGSFGLFCTFFTKYYAKFVVAKYLPKYGLRVSLSFISDYSEFVYDTSPSFRYNIQCVTKLYQCDGQKVGMQNCAHRASLGYIAHTL